MDSASAIVVTSINAVNAAMRQLRSGAIEAGAQMIVIGDIQSPSDFLIEGSRFLSIRDQIATGFSFAGLCPSRSYARKNVGYLVAAAGGAKIIVRDGRRQFPAAGFFWAAHPEYQRQRCHQRGLAQCLPPLHPLKHLAAWTAIGPCRRRGQIV